MITFQVPHTLLSRIFLVIASLRIWPGQILPEKVNKLKPKQLLHIVSPRDIYIHKQRNLDSTAP